MANGDATFRPRPAGATDGRRTTGIGSSSPQTNRTVARVAQGVGAYLVAAGFASAILAPTPLVRSPLAGYDPPFDAVAGLLLLAISFRLVWGGRVTWWFGLLGAALGVAAGIVSPTVPALLGLALSAALATSLYGARPAFDRPPSTSLGSIQLAVVVAGLLSLLYGMVGARLLGPQFGPEPGGVRTWSQAFYFTIATVTTVGYGDIAPHTDAARLFTAILILLGVGTFFSGIAVALPFLEGRLRSVAESLTRAQMQEFRDHVIICGTSPEVRPLVDALRERGVRCLVLSAHSDDVAELRAEGYPTHLGDPSSELVLREVGGEQARALVAAQESDAENLLTVITARALGPRVRIVALAKSASAAPKLERAGADEVVSLVTVGARLLAEAAVAASVPLVSR